MKKTFNRILSMALTIVMLFLATIPVFAVDNEEYLSDLRIIYAEDFEEAKAILADSEFDDYTIFNANLNENTGKTGVWLAYKTTTDIEDAITDISVMQMNGGYNEGNYQEMIQQSYNEYLEFGENYLTAIEYFKTGYDAGHYLSKIAHRQLNFYNVVTEGIDEIPEYEGELLGNIFFGSIDASDLATMFMEGNSYALANIRSLIAMGVSYNEDGKTYLEKVADGAEKYTADSTIYNDEEFDSIAGAIAYTLPVFKSMFNELEAYEPELNYGDEDFTDLEIQYLEYMSIATLMRGVNYLNGKTLYEFCMEYELNEEDYSDIYPLVAALNEGQLAMTKVNHFYDVVRYSVTTQSSETLDEELNAAEEKYAENPFNIYTGVDRTIYDGTFALTSAAFRADAFTESGLAAALKGPVGSTERLFNYIGMIGAGAVVSAGVLHISEKLILNSAKKKLNNLQNNFFENAPSDYWSNISFKYTTPKGVMDDIVEKYNIAKGNELYPTMTAQEKFDFLTNYIDENPSVISDLDKNAFEKLGEDWADAQVSNPTIKSATAKYNDAFESYFSHSGFYYTMYVVGGLMALASAIKLGIGIWNYYHPEYDDIPTTMVDLIDTKDGDRYIKYDVVLEAEEKEDGEYCAADLNAFSANRWNALYYTKSYEAGKPLLADSFVVSNSNNTPAKDYAPVHRFGEVVSYNLNKYNFNDDHSIFLSVKQSQNQKSAVADVPEIVGSVFSTGYLVLAGGVGALVGVGGVLGTQAIIKRKKQTVNPDAESATEE